MLLIGVPQSAGAASSKCSVAYGATSNDAAVPNADTSDDGSIAITVPAAIADDCRIGTLKFGPANSARPVACAGLAANTKSRPAPADTSALTRFLTSVAIALTPPPAVGVIGVTPLRMPPGVTPSSACVPNSALSSASALASVISARET